MNDTPPRPMPTPRPDVNADQLVYYRLERLEHGVGEMSRKLEKFMERIDERDSRNSVEFALAVDRCSSHTPRLETLEERARAQEAKFQAHMSDESTAVIRVVNSEIDRREFAATKDNTARWYGIGAMIAAALAGLAQAFGVGPK